MSSDNTFIARPKQPLRDHLNNVAAISREFAFKIDLPQAGELIGLLHDFGKYSKEFQEYLSTVTGLNDPDEDEYEDAKAKKGKIDHSTAGAQWIWQHLRNFGAQGQGELCAQILALCIASHHSGLIDCLKPNGDNNFTTRMGKIKTNYNECCKNADSEIIDKAKVLTGKGLLSEMGRKINAILKQRNSVSQSSPIPDFHLGFLARFLFSCLIDADRIDSAAVENPIYREIQNRRIDWSIAISRFERALNNFKVERFIDQLRREISDDCCHKAKAAQGIYTLTVPTGGGKTLASLRYALHHAREHNLDRIIYIIPYTSIIEQNAEAIRKMIEDEKDDFSWVLEHHSNLEPERQTWHSKIASDNWESPIVLTTMVQFLEALFGGGTRGVRRLHQLANSVLIFDEIQTLPIKCVHLFCNAINFLLDHGKTTVVLCTATQPLLNELRKPDKGQLYIPEGNELVKDVRKLFDSLKRVEISNKCKKEGGWKADEIKVLALHEFNNKGSCLVVVNTKSWAKKLYQLCQDEVSADAIFHLSTSQCSAHRKEMLKEIRFRLANGLPVLCISTQLIEAGVDISFASVIRFLAGLDSIAQAAGRCNRNGNLTDRTGNLIKGIVHVINPDDEVIDSLIDIEVGKNEAKRFFSEFQEDDVLSPGKMRIYFQYYFFKRADDMGYTLSAKEAERNDTLLNLLSANSRNIGLLDRTGKLPILQQSFMTAGMAFKAIDAPTQAVIVPYGEGKTLITKLCAVAKEFNAKAYYDLLKKAQQYTVNVFPNEWQKLQEQGAVYEIQNEGIYYLDERYYSEEFGLSMESVARMDNLVVGG